MPEDSSRTLERGTRESIRAFIAVDPPATVVSAALAMQQAIRSRIATCNARVSFVRAPNLHVTLAFLGNVHSAQASAIGAALSASLDGMPRFRVCSDGFGAFPSRRRARTLWIALDDDDGELQALHALVSDAVEDCGISVERRRFHPHLTVARVRHSRGDLLEGVAESRSEHGWVDRVTLYRSVLSSSGASYQALAEVSLGDEGQH